ncbi:MAG TPA: hypothetical protein VIP50_06275 [Agromyces sp.]
MKKRNVLTVIVALAAATALSACVGGAGPTASTPPATSAAPTSTPPTPEPPAAASVAITAETISVLAADGTVLESFDYFQPTNEVVAGLTRHLGDPVDSPNAGGLESPPGIDHVWGGLRLYDTDTAGSVPHDPNHYVFLDGPTAGPLPVGTAAGVGSATGVRVGDPPSVLTVGAEIAAPYTDPTTGRTIVTARIGIVPVPPQSGLTDPSFAVAVLSYTDTGEIERLIAPSSNFGV